MQVTVRDCITGQPLRPTFPAVFTFAKGGAATGITGGQLPSLFTPQLGVWRHTHGHNYTAVTDAFVFSAAGALIATHTFMRAIQVSDAGTRSLIKLPFKSSTPPATQSRRAAARPSRVAWNEWVKDRSK